MLKIFYYIVLFFHILDMVAVPMEVCLILTVLSLIHSVQGQAMVTLINTTAIVQEGDQFTVFIRKDGNANQDINCVVQVMIFSHSLIVLDGMKYDMRESKLCIYAS